MVAVLAPDNNDAGFRTRSRPALRLVDVDDRTAPRPDDVVELEQVRLVEPIVRHRPEVYRRRRMVAAGLAAAVVIGLWLGAHALIGSPSPTLGPTRAAAVKVWTVKPGDTLWSIAASVPHHGDIRNLVDQLSAEVHGRPLQVGEQITLP